MTEQVEKLKKAIEEEIKKRIEEASIVDIVNNLLILAFHLRASDIHFQPRENILLVRFRIDGILYDFFKIAKELSDEIISRIKILANLRIDEHFSAQDGRFRFYLEGAPIKYFDLRVSVIPTYYGENAILRLLVSDIGRFSLENLGLSQRDYEVLKTAISKPYGMILATGPTGSGKTTMLYSILNVLNTENVHIITLEDPIEYSLPGVTQIQVNPQTNLTFGKGLRAILRQDPNIIMVGEIRDTETAEIAVNAALTGHLLLSTLHTNDAPSAIVRLSELNIEPYLIASTVNCVIGQRLVRKICENCKKERLLKDIEIKSILDLLPQRIPDTTRTKLIKDLMMQNKKIFYGAGCEKCNSTGYFGRTGIYEILIMTENIRDLLLKNASASEIKNKAIEEGMTTMLEDGIKKIFEGATTIEEVLRVTHE